MADENEPFCLSPYEVPDFPASRRWVDQLRWCIAVMDHDDPDLSFLASLLSHAAGERGGLTEKQGKYARRTVERIQALHVACMLECQQEAVSPDDLGARPPAGNA